MAHTLSYMIDLYTTTSDRWSNHPRVLVIVSDFRAVVVPQYLSDMGIVCWLCAFVPQMVSLSIAGTSEHPVPGVYRNDQELATQNAPEAYSALSSSHAWGVGVLPQLCWMLFKTCRGSHRLQPQLVRRTLARISNNILWETAAKETLPLWLFNLKKCHCSYRGYGKWFQASSSQTPSKGDKNICSPRKNRYGCYPQIIHFNRDFHYKPSIWGTTIFGNTHMNINTAVFSRSTGYPPTLLQDTLPAPKCRPPKKAKYFLKDLWFSPFRCFQKWGYSKMDGENHGKPY